VLDPVAVEVVDDDVARIGARYAPAFWHRVATVRTARVGNAGPAAIVRRR
jgi:hypothetical protein